MGFKDVETAFFMSVTFRDHGFALRRAFFIDNMKSCIHHEPVYRRCKWQAPTTSHGSGFAAGS